MDFWRVENRGGERPAVMSGGNLARAFLIHVLLFAVLFVYACVKGLFDREPDDAIHFIDPTVVVNENLDGEENEPPPLENPEPEPEPEPEPPPVPQVKKPDPPKELEKVVTNIVEKVEKKEEKKKEEKPPEKQPEKPKPPEKPKKTKEQLKKERLEKMRKNAKVVNKTVTITVKAPSGNGRTQRKTLTDAQIRDLLNKGYRPGTSEQIATSDLQLGYSLIKTAFESKWDQPPWTDRLRPMTIRVWFGGGGRVVSYKLEKSSGDIRADQSIRAAASRVGAIPGLPASFIDKFRSSGVPIQFTVKPQ